MPSITININKATVWDEVAKTTGYTGDKLTDSDENAYERILITDEDQKSLQRFWEETASVANEQLKEMIETASSLTSDYNVTLHVSRSYDTVLNNSVQSALQSYFIASIVARWYKFSNKAEAESYFAEGEAMMQDALRKLYSRKRPKRPNRETTPKPGFPTVDPVIPDVKL